MSTARLAVTVVHCIVQQGHGQGCHVQIANEEYSSDTVS